MRPIYSPIILEEDQFPSQVVARMKNMSAKTIVKLYKLGTRANFSKDHLGLYSSPAQGLRLSKEVEKELIKKLMTLSNYYPHKPFCTFVKKEQKWSKYIKPEQTQQSTNIGQTSPTNTKVMNANRGNQSEVICPPGNNNKGVVLQASDPDVNSIAQGLLDFDNLTMLRGQQSLGDPNSPASGPITNVIERKVKNLRTILNKVLDFGQDEESIRINTKRFLRNKMSSYPSFKKCQKKEAGRRSLIFLPDTSESCEDLSKISMNLSMQASIIGQYGGDVLVLENYNMGQLLSKHTNGKKSTKHEKENNTVYDELRCIIAQGNSPIMIYIGDSDGAGVIKQLKQKDIIVNCLLIPREHRMSSFYEFLSHKRIVCGVNEANLLNSLDILLTRITKC